MIQNLKKGDVICVPHSNRLYLGIFSDIGKSNNIRYYPAWSEAYISSIEDRLKQNKKPKVSWVSRFVDSDLWFAVVKVDPETLPEEPKMNVYGVIDVLKKGGVL